MANTLNTLQRNGASAVPWQQAELALHLVYTFGEMAKSECSTPGGLGKKGVC